MWETWIQSDRFPARRRLTRKSPFRKQACEHARRSRLRCKPREATGKPRLGEDAARYGSNPERRERHDSCERCGISKTDRRRSRSGVEVAKSDNQATRCAREAVSALGSMDTPSAKTVRLARTCLTRGRRQSENSHDHKSLVAQKKKRAVSVFGVPPDRVYSSPPPLMCSVERGARAREANCRRVAAAYNGR
jgi:hypothetical protein